MGTSLPLISSIATYFTGTVTEEFRKLFKPASLVLASIFLVLNLVLILPTLAEAGVAPVVALQSFSTAWQLALGLVALLTLGYLFNSLGGFFIGFVNGSLFTNTIIGDRLLEFQFAAFQSKQDDLKAHGRKGPVEKDDLKSIRDANKAARALHQIAYNFPEQEYMAPTRVGNIMACLDYYIWTQYGCSLDLFLPVMEYILEKENPELRKKLLQNSDNLTFLTSLVVILILVGLEFLIIKLTFSFPGEALWTLAIFLLAYVVYLATVQKSEAWARDIRTAFDLYHSNLETLLHLTEIKGYGAEEKRKHRLEQVSRWLAFGAVNLEDSIFDPALRSPEWYVETKSLRDVNIISPRVEIVENTRTIRNPTWTFEKEEGELRLKGEISYLFIVTNPLHGNDAREAKNVAIIVNDNRIPFISSDHVRMRITDDDLQMKKTFIDGGLSGPDAILWYLGDIPANESKILEYSVEYWPISIRLIKTQPGDHNVRMEYQKLYEDQDPGQIPIFVNVEQQDKVQPSGNMKMCMEIVNQDSELIEIRLGGKTEPVTFEQKLSPNTSNPKRSWEWEIVLESDKKHCIVFRIDNKNGG